MRHISTFSFRKLIGRATFFAALFVVIGIIFGYGLPVFAQGDYGLAEVDSQIGLSGTSIVLIIVQVIRILLGFLGLVLVIMIIYAGYMIMTSAGNEDKVTQGKTILKNAVIGTAIILFSFIIVQFIINLLMDVTGLKPGQKQPPGIETFAGIGSLGEVIKDHYPMPNQTEVYRNTKVVITFTEAIDPSSLIMNENNTCWGQNNESTTVCDEDALPYYGDCAEVSGETVCDTLKTDVVLIHKLIEKGGLTDGDVISFDALVAYENINEAHTFVFKLQGNDLFGNGEEDQWHQVEVTNSVQNMDGVGVFDNHINKGYQWDFETNTEIDLTPPYVVDVSPNPGETVEKNRILKMTFNEAVDPMTVQGMLSADSSFTNVIVDVIGNGDTPNIQDVGESISGLYSQGIFSDAGNNPIKIHVDGTDVYVLYTSKIVKFDASDPATLVNTNLVFSSVSGGSPRAMTVEGSYLYVVGGGPSSSKGTLHIIDTSTMQEVGKTDTLTIPASVAIMNDYAYVADYINGIRIIKIDNPTKPTLVNTLVDTLDNSVANFFGVAVYDGRLYFAKRGGAQFGVADLSDPEQPKIIKQVIAGMTPRDMVFTGTSAYLAVRGSGVRIVDISDPENGMPIQQFVPQQHGANDTAVFSLNIHDNFLAVGGQHTIKLFDIGRGDEVPSFVASYPGVDETWLPIDNYRPVFFSGDYLYAGYRGKGVIVFDTVMEPGEEDAEEEENTESVVSTVEVEGQWKITNGYRTIEFLSSSTCGNNAVNSCGEPLYCLPTDCADYDKTCTASYSVLARTASLKDSSMDAEGNSFVSASIFDGVVDMADNAMDSAPNIDSTGSVIPGSFDNIVYAAFKDDPINKWRHKPPFIGTKKDIDVEELYPDNYWWNFTVINDIDSTSPYIRQVEPGIDNQGVIPFEPVDVHFSKEMWIDTLTYTSLIEYPNSDIGLGYMHDTEDVIAVQTFGSEEKTITRSILSILHPARPFGPGETDYWYFTNVPGIVKAVNQFCLYPGRGPYDTDPQQGLSDPSCEVTYDENWNITGVSGDCSPGDIQITSSTDTGCISTHTGLPQVMGDTDTCINEFSDDKVSKSVFKSLQ